MIGGSGFLAVHATVNVRRLAVSPEAVCVESFGDLPIRYEKIAKGIRRSSCLVKRF